MLTQTTENIATIIYGLLIGSATVWLAWVCFAHLPFLAALIFFPAAFVLAAMAGAPLAAGASFAIGFLIAVALAIGRKLMAASRTTTTKR
ncbi:MAG: hypothetical protein JSS58_01935 [Proteobacteria bacterium]|nr:hypothetical protein [Pseudomonadota bacterium]